LSTLIVSALVLRWSWENGAHPSAAPLTDDEPRNPPLHSRTCDGPGLWGMVVTLMANGTLYLSLLFGWLYLWAVAPHWSVPDEGAVAKLPLLASGSVLSLAVVLYQRTVLRLRQGEVAGLQSTLWQIALLGLGHVISLLWVLQTARLRPTELAHDAVLTVMLIYLLIHASLSTVLTAMQATRVRRGYVGRGLPYEPIVLQPLWIYTLGVFWLSFIAFVLLPDAWVSH
jgi:cytochrome c oxidase subunit I+III